MTKVNVSTAGKTTVIKDTDTNIVSVTTAGPQGASAGIVVDADAKVDKSVVYYDASVARFKADALWTTRTLTDGGNF